LISFFFISGAVGDGSVRLDQGRGKGSDVGIFSEDGRLDDGVEAFRALAQ
jgi:hypothetical protein